MIYIVVKLYTTRECFTADLSIKNKIYYGLRIMDKLFNENNIYYTIAYGTLLGAVRHSDMIPWDDDGDVNVLIKDFNKIMALKDEFRKNGLILETDYKLIKIYFDDSKYPFIDLFINDISDNKIVRCLTPENGNSYCKQLSKSNEWWWKWLDYPAEWIINRKRFKFGPIKVWGPTYSEKILKYWYGENCLTVCKSPSYDHITGEYVKEDDLHCGNLPKLQL